MNLRRLFKLAAEWQDKLPGGIADQATPADFDPESLQEGLLIELEHTNNRQLAMEIAMDHLSEDPNYYSKLKAVESYECHVCGDTRLPESEYEGEWPQCPGCGVV